MDFKQIVKDVLLTEAKELEKAASNISFDIEKAMKKDFSSEKKRKG